MLITQEVGSLPKPAWFLKSKAGLQVSKADLIEAKFWGDELEIADNDKLIRLLQEQDSPRKRAEIKKWVVTYAIRFLEKSGLDIVYTGEMLRVEMYEHPASRISGLKFSGKVQSLDNKYYRIASVVQAVTRKRPIYLQELKLAKSIARKRLKVPVIGPYTLADWTLDDYYVRKILNQAGSLKEARQKAKADLIFDLVEKVLRPEIKELVENGAERIQIDEPAATCHPQKEEMQIFVESFNTLTKGFPSKFSIHNCYSDYSILAKYAPELKNCSQLTLEFANRDSLRLGTGIQDRHGYANLRQFIEHGYSGEFGVGVLNVHDFEGEIRENVKIVNNTLIESPELIRDRLLFVQKIVRDSSKIAVNPDCGLRTRKDWKIIMQKLRNMVEGTRKTGF